MSIPVSEYKRAADLYQFLPVMDGYQIKKLRNIAIGILDMSAFSPAELYFLEQLLSSYRSMQPASAITALQNSKVPGSL